MSFFSVSVDELVRLCLSAYNVLVPVLEKAKIPWREPSNYDDWDNIAASIFDSIVIKSITNSKDSGNIQPFVGYDVRVSEYGNFSYIANKAHPDLLAFLCFETKISPFDSCLFARLGADMKVQDTVLLPTNSVYFVGVGAEGGGGKIFDVLNVEL